MSILGFSLSIGGCAAYRTTNPYTVMRYLKKNMGNQFFTKHLILDKFTQPINMTKSDVLGQRLALFNKKRN
jgi:hypothetical protein